MAVGFQFNGDKVSRIGRVSEAQKAGPFKPSPSVYQGFIKVA